MVYRVIIKTPQLWLVDDQPDVTGTLTGDGAAPNMLGATVRLVRPYLNQDLLTETAAALPDPGSGKFSVVVPFSFTQQDNGVIAVAVLIDSGARGTIDAGINAADTTVEEVMVTDIVSFTTVDVTETIGPIPANGRFLIDNEWIAYSLSGTTLTMTRGIFGTTATTHAINTECKFSQIKETATPYYPWQVLRKDALE